MRSLKVVVIGYSAFGSFLVLRPEEGRPKFPRVSRVSHTSLWMVRGA